MARLMRFLRSNAFFYALIGLFIVSAAWIATTSLYPMAFDEEFHYGLIQIYATSILPFGIEHTSDMAQYGSATADASYLFNYLMSFPYRLLAFFGLPDTAIIINLRYMNIAMVAAALLVFRRAFTEAGLSRPVSMISLALVASIPVFPLLAAHINYDNLMLLVFAWGLLLLVRLTNQVRQNQPLRLADSIQLLAALLIGMSIKYAFLPLALAMALWVVWLIVRSYRQHAQSISSQLASYRAEWAATTKQRQRLLASILIISTFFASHYVTNTVTYGSPIPSCERVFSETECQAYGPWNRNRNYEAAKSESFVPLTFFSYMKTEWFPGMTERLTFAVAGKTNGFQTKDPLPALVTSYVILSCIGLAALIIQISRKKMPWITALAALMTAIYVGALSFQLYGDYVDTAVPVALNGRYLLPLLPLISVVLITALRKTLASVTSGRLALFTAGMAVLLLISGAGISTYVIQAESHWFYPGAGRESHDVLQSVFTPITLPYRQ